jgi:hypothetical protein
VSRESTGRPNKIGRSPVYNFVNVSDRVRLQARLHARTAAILSAEVVMSCRKPAVLLLLFPLGLAAQTSSRPVAVGSSPRVPILTPAPDARQAAVCDGSAIRGARHQAYFGLAMMGASLPVSLVGMYKTVHSPTHPEGPVATGVAMGAALAIGGYFVAATSRPGESFWDGVIARMKTGQTRSADVRTCLDRPSARVQSDSLDEWTYITSQGRWIKSVKLTFRDSVLVGIKRAEVAAALVERRSDPAAIMAPVIPPVIPSPPER